MAVRSVRPVSWVSIRISSLLPRVQNASEERFQPPLQLSCVKHVQRVSISIRPVLRVVYRVMLVRVTRRWAVLSVHRALLVRSRIRVSNRRVRRVLRVDLVM